MNFLVAHRKWWLPAVLALAFGAYQAYALAFWVYSLPQDKLLPFSDNFESADLRHWQGLGWQQLCCAHSLTVVADPQAADRHAARFELRRGDAHQRGSARAEVRLPAAEMGATYRYRFRVWLPADWSTDAAAVTLAQWHSVSDKVFFEGGLSPPLRLAALGDQWVVENIWDRAWVSKWLGQKTEHPEGARRLWSGPLERGRWVAWEFVVRWSWQGDGVVEVLKDGQPLVHASGPNTYRDLVGPYMKVGIYIPLWAIDGEPVTIKQRVAYFDEIGFERR